MEAEKFVGQEAIFLFDGLRQIGVGKNTFPKPKYIGVTGGYWSDCLPIPMSQLERVAFIAKQAGFVVPSRHNSVLL